MDSFSVQYNDISAVLWLCAACGLTLHVINAVDDDDDNDDDSLFKSVIHTCDRINFSCHNDYFLAKYYL